MGDKRPKVRAVYGSRFEEKRNTAGGRGKLGGLDMLIVVPNEAGPKFLARFFGKSTSSGTNLPG